MRLTMLAAIVSIAAGCTQAARGPDADGAVLQALLPPASLGENLSLSQLVVGEFQGQTHSLHIEIEITPTRMVMVGLTPMGVPIFTLEQEANEIEVQTLGSDSFPFDPRHILSDFQIAYWPEAVLSDKFHSFGLTVRETPTAGSREILAESGEVLVAVTYLDNADGAGDIIIEHFDPPYRLQIETFEKSVPR